MNVSNIKEFLDSFTESVEGMESASKKEISRQNVLHEAANRIGPIRDRERVTDLHGMDDRVLASLLRKLSEKKLSEK